MKHTLEASAARTQGKPHAEPINMQKRIGSTTFKVAIHFSKSSQETVEDKLLRLIKREGEQLCLTLHVPQAFKTAGKRQT